MTHFHFTKLKVPIMASLSLLLSVGAIIFMATTITRTSGELRAYAQTFADDTAYSASYHALAALLEDTKEERARLQALTMQGEDDTVAFLSLLEGYATRLGITLETKSLEVIVNENDSYDTLAISFEIEGTEDEVWRFLELLERVPYHAMIKSATFSRDRSEETDLMMLGSTIVLYVTINKEES